MNRTKVEGITQERINTIVHESCILFCEHCGCGVPRDTCISLGTCDEYDDYRKHIRTYLEKKKKEYPKTYEECCKILEIDNSAYLTSDKEGYWNDYELSLNYLIEHFRKLVICRDAYWKLAGEEMGLGKPWEPNWKSLDPQYIILYQYGSIDKAETHGEGNYILSFPTEEMRDAFYENFKDLIEQCKELL